MMADGGGDGGKSSSECGTGCGVVVLMLAVCGNNG